MIDTRTPEQRRRIMQSVGTRIRIDGLFGISFRRAPIIEGRSDQELLCRRWALKKMEIAKLLLERHGFKKFLEISTPTTGCKFDEMVGPDDALLHRLVYKCPDEQDDGMTYTYRTADPVSYELTRTIAAENQGVPLYDLIFVDPFHSYLCSATDLSGAFVLLKSGGILLVHDCNPTDAAIVKPEFTPGSWCGVTYQAFIDFVLCRKDVSYYTVDTDFGCGVVYKHPARIVIANLQGDELNELSFAWDMARHDDTTRFKFFERRRTELLNLKSVEEFVALEGVILPAPPPPSPGLS